MSEDSQKSKFFRQSGWMVMCTFLGGACMFAVHFFAPFLGDAEYGLLGTLLAMMNVMMIPSIGLQITLAQEGAAAISPEDLAKYAGTVRGVLWWTFLLWLGMVFFAAVFQIQLIEVLTITNPIALWLVVIIGLGLLWQPILQGVLQGRQNFLWLGWVLIANGAGRLITVAIIILFLGGKATGAICGALIGISLAIFIGLIQTREVWGRKERLPFDWRQWLQRVVPLTLGLGTSQFIFSIDMIIVRALYGEHQTGFYSAAGMIGRGLVMFTAPLAAVMFPKVVQSAVQKRKTNVLVLTLISTAVLGIISAGFCTIISKILLLSINSPQTVAGFIPAGIFSKLQQHPDAVRALGEMIPWFVWCMLPLALANVLLNNLMARMQYSVVPYLVVVVGIYANAAIYFGSSFIRVIQILGIFNLIYLAVLVYFTHLAGLMEKKNTLAQQTSPIPPIT